MSAAAQSSNQAANKQPANYPPAAKPVGGAVSSAGPAKTTQNGASPTSLILQTQKRRQQRLELLREIYEQARDCWSNMPNSKLRSKAWSPPSLRRKPPMRKSMPPAPPCWRESIAQTGVVRDAALIQSLMQQYATLDGEASQLKIKRKQQATDHAELMAKVKQVDEQAAELRSSWLAVVDPFGQLEHGDEDSALASFTEWTVLEPERPGPWLARGFAYWQLRQFDNALADFNTAVKLAGPMLTNSLAARAVCCTPCNGRKRPCPTSARR